MSKLNTDDRSAHSGYVPAGVVRIVQAGIDRSFSMNHKRVGRGPGT
jgi:hypothetical protein